MYSNVTALIVLGYCFEVEVIQLKYNISCIIDLLIFRRKKRFL